MVGWMVGWIQAGVWCECLVSLQQQHQQHQQDDGCEVWLVERSFLEGGESDVRDSIIRSGVAALEVIASVVGVD